MNPAAPHSDAPPPAGDGAPLTSVSRPRRRRWADAALAGSGGWLAAMWGWRTAAALAGAATAAQERATVAGMLPIGLVIVLVIGLVPARDGVDARTGAAWRRIALAFVAWWTAGIVWELVDRAPLSWADPVQMLFFPLVLWGVLGFPAERLDRTARVRFGLDSGIVVLSGAAGAWFFVLWPSLAAGAPDALSLLVNALYPVWDLVLLLALCAALLRRPDPTLRRALVWVAVGLLGRFVGDLLFGWQNAAGGYQPGGATDLTWLSGGWAVAVGARVSGRAAARAAQTAAPAPTNDATFGFLPYVSVATLFAFLLVVAHGTITGVAWSGRAYGVLLAAVAATGLVLARQLLATRELVRLQRERAAQEAAQAVEARFASLVRHASDVVAIIDPTGVVRFTSPSIARLLGVDASAAVGRSIVDFVHPDDAAHARAALAHADDPPGATTGPTVLRVRHADGTWRRMECLRTNLLADPHVRGVLVTARDVTERVRLEEQLVHQAFHDPLTGLANRALFRDRVAHALSMSSRQPATAAVLFLDLDDFKTVNDTLGHAAGDQLLRTVAERLRGATREGDTVARLGGDEFAVLLEGATGEVDAVAVAERIARALVAPVRVGDGEVPVGASIGIARARAEDGPDELLRNADVAMYRAKHGGKGAWAEFEPAMHAELVDRLALEADLRRELAAPRPSEFHLAYQPIVELATGAAVGMEALVRWRHPQRGLLAPAAFIPIAESSGLVEALGAWVLREACRQGAAWLAEHAAHAERAPCAAAPFTVSVNLSGRQLQHPGLVAGVAGVLAATGLPPACLVLEITETVIMHDVEPTLATLHALKALGVRLAVDDFGTGYSSLGYLQRFPIDILKIDKTFVDGIASEGGDAALTRTIVALGDALGLHTVAEGVEDEGQRAHLRALGCRYGQGYLFARPLPADDALALLRAAWAAPAADAGATRTAA